MSEQLWPERLRRISRSRFRELSDGSAQGMRRAQEQVRRVHAAVHQVSARAKLRLRDDVRNVRVRLAERGQLLWLPIDKQLRLVRVLYRSRRTAVLVGVLATVTAIELVLALPLLIGPSREAADSVQRAAQAIVDKATPDEGAVAGPTADGAASQSESDTRQGPGGKHVPLGATAAGGDSEEEPEALLSEQGATGAASPETTNAPGRDERASPARPEGTEKSGTPGGTREAPPASSVTPPSSPPPPPSPQTPNPQSPPAPSVTPPPPPASSPPSPPPPAPPAPTSSPPSPPDNEGSPPPPPPPPPPSDDDDDDDDDDGGGKKGGGKKGGGHHDDDDDDDGGGGGDDDD